MKFNDYYIYKSVLDFAMKGHEGQYRKDGVTPYVQHPIRVANHLAMDGYGIIFQVVALLHDYIEDADDRDVARKAVHDLLEELCSENTVNTIYLSLLLLTRGEHESVKRYHGGIYTDKIAITVKVYDKFDNVHDMDGVFSDEKIVEYCNIIQDFVIGLSGNGLIRNDETLETRIYTLIADLEYNKLCAKGRIEADKIKPFEVKDLKVIEYTKIPWRWEIQLPYDGRFRIFQIDEYGDEYIIYTVIDGSYYHLVKTEPDVLFISHNMDLDVFRRHCCFGSLGQIVEMINKYIEVKND